MTDSGKTQTGTYTLVKDGAAAGSVTFAEGKATVSITGAGSVTIQGLPADRYTVTEKPVDVPYYSCTNDGPKTANLTGEAPYSVTITNRFEAEENPNIPTGTITLIKQVKEAGASGLLGGVTDGKTYYFQIEGTDAQEMPVNEIVSVTVQNGSGEFSKTLAYGTYTVTELEADVAGTAADESLPDIDGYAWQGVTYDGANQVTLNESNTAASVTATNTYEAEAIAIPVLKRWNGDGSRPSSITVELYKDGAATGETQVLTASGNWQGEFTEIDGAPLYKYEDGKAVSYSVRETKFGSATVYGNVYGYWSISTGATTAEAAGLWSEEAGAENAYGADDLVLVVTNSYYVPDPGDGDGGDDDDPPTPPTGPEDPEEPVEIPEDPTPLDPGPGEEPVEIPEDPTPLAPEPEEEITIDEDGVPLGDLPQTGAVAEAVNPAVTLGLVAISLSLAALGLQITITRKKEEEEY